MNRVPAPFRTLPLAACLAALAACGHDAALGPGGGPRLSAGAPAAPADLRASVNANGVVRVDFTHDGAGVTHLRFHRRNATVAGAPWTLVRATDNTGLRAFSDRSYDPLYHAWAWQVEACNAAGCAPGPAAGLTRLSIAAPTELDFGAGGPARVDL